MIQYFLPLLLLLPSLAFAQSTPVVVKLSSGTGFVINNEGNIITNAHVVRGCQGISVLTPKGQMMASLVVADAAQDLAVLKVPYIPEQYASLRWDISSLRVGDEVTLMGYPGTQGAVGHGLFKKTRLRALGGPSGEAHFLQLNPVADHGNSGGPVLDSAGHVIAVITGIVSEYRKDGNGKPLDTPTDTYDIAITLAALRDFLNQHGISFYQSASSLTLESDDRLLEEGKHFILPVRCLQGVNPI